MSAPAASRDERQHAATQWPKSPRRILVAEDEHLLARKLCADLTELGYEVIGPVSNGKRAIELASEQRPDLALLDIRMPEMDGLDAGRVLYDQMNIPLVIVTAYCEPAYVDESAKMGVFGYLLKPINSNDLRATIAVAWNRYLERQNLAGQVRELQVKLENRKLIEKAKGLIMAKVGLTEEQAMRRLQKQARDSRRAMADLAQSIIDAQDLLGDADGPPDQAGK